uniref:Laccase n=1 Tax=Nicotiana tabacum TaxID=4097 RepID=A0A1S4CYC2_TOBAC|nr:PREDICTED: laccase-15-like [Nicotiana tabacum]
MAGKLVMKKSTLSFILLATFFLSVAYGRHYRFIIWLNNVAWPQVREVSINRLCESKKILTVNGQFPGPTIYAHKGETIIVDVYNKGKYNVTIHWHGVKQPRYPWSDGPEYITQCPIQAGGRFKQKIILSDEKGTLWWHAHSGWQRSTVHGALVVYPKQGTTYPFPKPHREIPIIIGEWWKEDIKKLVDEFVASGGQSRNSDAFTINGQPGDLYPCSKNGTFKLEVEFGKTYLLRFISAVMNELMFVKIANHNLTVVGIDGSYTKPLTREYIMITPGQSIDCILKTNQKGDQYYYLAARAYSNGTTFDNTTTTAILKYKGKDHKTSSPPLFPYLPSYYNTTAAVNFSGSLRSLASKKHPIFVPLEIKERMISTISINAFPCPANGTNSTCQGPNRTRFAASMNNISFVKPTYDILEAYYYHINGVFGTKFPSFPPFKFNYTADYMPLELEISDLGTEVKVLKYNTTVEMVLQDTNLVGSLDHPMHLHGYNYYVVGWGFGNFDEKKDPLNYNLVDPPRVNTIAVPKNGWTAIRFKADNTGVWFMHCHIERHITWGMKTAFLVEDGEYPEERMLPPPPDMPPC